MAGCARGGRAGSFLDDLTAEDERRCLHTTCDVRAAGDVVRFRAPGAGDAGAAGHRGQQRRHRGRGRRARPGRRDVERRSGREPDRDAFLVTQAFLAAMKARGGGRIINLASISGRTGTRHALRLLRGQARRGRADARPGRGAARRRHRGQRHLSRLGRHRDAGAGHARRARPT